MRTPLTFRTSGALLLIGIVALALGCSGASGPRANVKGKVTIGGKALTTGTVVFYGDNNRTSTSNIDPEGNYLMSDAPVGEVKITVSVPKPPPGGIGAAKMKGMMKGMKDAKSVDPETGKVISIMGNMPSEIVPIPEKYSSVENSGLTYTVTRGDQTKDLPLNP